MDKQFKKNQEILKVEEAIIEISKILSDECKVRQFHLAITQLYKLEKLFDLYEKIQKE